MNRHLPYGELLIYQQGATPWLFKRVALQYKHVIHLNKLCDPNRKETTKYILKDNSSVCA